MKYHFLIPALALILLSTGCQSSHSSKSEASGSDSTYTLTGSIAGLDTGWVYLRHRQRAENNLDSARIKNGQFVFSGRADAPEFCNFGAQREGKKEFYFGFFLQDGELTLMGKKDSLSDAAIRITGSPVASEFQKFQKSVKFIDSLGNQLDLRYQDAKTKNDKTREDSIVKAVEGLNKMQVEIAVDYAGSHPSSYVSAFEIYSNFSYNLDKDQLDAIYKKLDSTIQASYFGKKISKTLEIANQTAIGKPAPLFAQNDIQGKSVPLASFKGKYVLIDFWASWCGPCRAENPAVVKAYKHYHSKGLDILGVSLDEDKDKWAEAIKKDQLNWAQVSDLKGWENSAAMQYGVQGIPMNFLLDPQGEIIGKDLRGADLDKKLAETLTQ